jgi:type IV fimbrial biogenesis protein FimT
MNMRTSGFTLIELMIALVIFAVLVLLAGPLYADFIGNTQIRTAAENSYAGVRLAQTNAVRSNRPAKFVLDPSAAGGWAVYVYNDELPGFDPATETYKWTAGAPKTTVTPLPAGATSVTFDGLGRIVANGYPAVADGTASLAEIDVTNTSVGTPRDLHVVISAAGGTTAMKLCDPLVLAPDPRTCS